MEVLRQTAIMGKLQKTTLSIINVIKFVNIKDK